jgi:hypothetical protein
LRNGSVSAISGSSTNVWRFGNSLEIDLGLARSGDTVEQEGLECLCVDSLDQRLRDGCLDGGKIGCAIGRVGQRERGVDIHLDRLDRPHFHQPADHRIGHVSDDGEFADEPLAFLQAVERLFALGGQPFGPMTAQPVLGDRPAPFERG